MIRLGARDRPAPAAPAKVPEVLTLGPPRLTAGLHGPQRRLDLRGHLAVHGPLGPLSATGLIELAERVKLAGRGGAGFPFAKKVRAVLASVDRRTVAPAVVVNATEGEPAAWKDKVLLTRAPHLILDGAALVAWALHAAEIVISVADDGIGEASMLAALREQPLPAPARLVRVPHRFISGEGGALVQGVNGLPHIPPGIKRRASDAGVDGRPTLLSNAETFAQLAVAARLGPARYAELGEDEPGTVLLSVTGSAARPAVVECAAGTPVSAVLDACGVPDGPAVLFGGFHGRWVPLAKARTATFSRRGLRAAGGSLGAGIVLPLDHATCPLGEVARVVRYLAAESAGQCGPCRLGLPDLARAVDAVVAGTGDPAAVRAAAGAVVGRGACSHPDGTAGFATSALEAFADDLHRHVTAGTCGRPVRGTLPIPGTTPNGDRRLTVDWSRCDAHGLCADVAPDLIRLDTNGFPALGDAPIPPRLEPLAREAIAVCPALALRLATPKH
ncbi:NADH-ubiquinone oxidoreductase-F iron-sulfur binding region domain-containing protein [Dactylosporangium sp. AC04546]|uniref:NADH-ubiquinone oxidoreductase-F iron-sulfur binding region domain-containing protein n=1 Tax=Dactylosporangium sp. AC04546 TaxID=2862460 RepID=UPI001EDF5D4F|nr:NADH-ubiquinone oxidoreductase-F iron-sulfur binding region domain-containing protein [Dactylosporangium sp. AC04546]WVK82453.1 NADH-ubiquinone oxidoreductase-F iron-sulfur binding region domain-containing protein [Dactylosporangium sp. AC04546]